MKYVDLFAGLGGLSLGLEWAGHECVGQVEIEDYPFAVLERHWPDVPKIRDVRDFEGDEFGHFDLLAGGYPCQPFSYTSGRRKGADDPRHLWPEVHRIVRNVRPRAVLLENVLGHLTLGFDRVLGDLAEIGYDAEWQCYSASSVGAPQPRERLFIVAYPNGSRESLVREHDETRILPPSTESGWQDWPPYSRDWGVDDGLSRRVERLRGLGNAVVPQVAQMIGERLK